MGERLRFLLRRRPRKEEKWPRIPIATHANFPAQGSTSIWSTCGQCRSRIIAFCGLILLSGSCELKQVADVVLSLLVNRIDLRSSGVTAYISSYERPREGKERIARLPNDVWPLFSDALFRIIGARPAAYLMNEGPKRLFKLNGAHASVVGRSKALFPLHNLPEKLSSREGISPTAESLTKARSEEWQYTT